MISFDNRRVVVSCQGDIAVNTFGPHDDVVWLRLSQGPVGEIGRSTNEEPVDLDTCEGVLIGAKNPRSLDVLIEALTILRHKLTEP